MGDVCSWLISISVREIRVYPLRTPLELVIIVEVVVHQSWLRVRVVFAESARLVPGTVLDSPAVPPVPPHAFV